MTTERKSVMKEKKLKFRLSGLLLALILAVAMLPISVIAAGNNGTISVSNIEAGAVVKAYQIVKQDANGDWETVIANSIVDPKAPTAAEITALAKNVSNLGAGTTLSEGTTATTADGVTFKTYSKSNMSAGMYLVLVEKANNVYVYNPVIVSVNYDYEGDEPELKGGTVDADSNFTVGNSSAYAKRSKPTLNKEITGKTANSKVNGDSTKVGDTLAVGDTVSFKIETTIPAYSGQYDNDNLKFEISDTVSTGLNAPTNIVVKEADTVLIENTHYTLVKSNNNKTFTIKFKKEYLLSGFAKNIKVTYDSELNQNASSGFDANTNTAGIVYSNSPSTTDNKEAETYHYTFDIDGNVFGQMTGREIVKVGKDETSGELITKETNTQTTKPLPGAEFQLLDKDKNVLKTTTSTTAGLLTFRGLDAGEYYLKETKAPEGYSTDSTLVPVVISAVLNADGTLASYTVTINGTNSTTYTWNNSGQTPTVDKTGDTSLFNNYKPGLLPSTGGNGIYFYIIAGIILIAMATAVYVIIRKKDARRAG